MDRLVEVQKRYDPFVLAICEGTNLRILWVSLGTVRADVCVEGPRRKHTRMLQHVASDRRFSHLVLAGTPREISELCGGYGAPALSTIAGTVTGVSGDIGKIVSAAMVALQGFRES